MKRYRVKAGRIFDREPGEEFTRDIPPIQEQRLVAGGGLEILSEDSESGLHKLTRDELNARAEDLGVENPADLPNKEQVIEAILATEGADTTNEEG